MEPKKIKNLLGLIHSVELADISANYNRWIESCLNVNFPIYSLNHLIKAKRESVSPIANKLNDGWIDKSVDSEIQKMQKEIDRLKRIKLIELPIIDKTWKRAVFIVVIIALIITIPILFQNKNLSEKTEKLAVEKDAKIVENVILEEKVGKVTKLTIDQEHELMSLSDSITNTSNRIFSLTTLLETKDREIYLQNRKLDDYKSEVRSLKNSLNKLKTDVDDYLFDKQILNNKVKILKKSIEELNNVRFNIGESYIESRSCRGIYTEEDKLYFDTYHAILLRSIKVKAKKNGYANFYVRDNASKKLIRKRIYLSKGVQTVNLDIEVSEGIGHYLSSSDVKLYSIKKCYRFPYSVKNLITLKSGGSGYYPSYFDWVISAKI